MKFKYAIQANLFAICTFLFSSCSLDNYDAPYGGLNGIIVDSKTGLSVPQPVNATTGLTVRLVQQDWEVEADAQLFYGNENGQFINGQLFSGIYTMSLEQTNFFPVEPRTIVIDGQTAATVEVVPYANIEIKDLSINNLSINADVLVSRSWDWKTDDKDCKITSIKLYWNVSNHIDKESTHNLGSGNVDCNSLSDQDILSEPQTTYALISATDINKYAHFIKANGNKIYVRAAVVTSCGGKEYYNYSNAQELYIDL